MTAMRFGTGVLTLESGKRPNWQGFVRLSRRRVRAIAGFLEEGVKEVIVKRGNQGASYYSANEQFHVESYPVEEVDPTGAGDCFGGAWIACRQLGFDAHRALQYANACGALAVTRRGPMEGTSRLAEIEAFIQRHDMSIREAAQ